MPGLEEKTDEQIAKMVQDGDIESFGILVRRYEAKMMRYARRFLFGTEDAEDNVQDVFAKAFVNIKSFDTKRKFNSWIYRIAHNEFINAIKKKEKQPLLFFDSDTLFPHPVADEETDQSIKDEDVKKLLEKCLDKISSKYREILILYYFEDLDYSEIADILKIPTSTVGVRLRRGRQAMQEVIKKMDIEI